MTEASDKARSRSGTSRRRFLELASMGAAAGLLTGAGGISVVRAESSTEILLLSCMDYRLMDDIERYMAGRGLRDKYDHIVLAGASLGAITDKYPAWNQTFWEHLDVAIALHHVQTVIVMDHRDCGAYKVVLGTAVVADPATERKTHATQLQQLKRQINAKQPKLSVELLLMSLDGKVEAIAG